MWVGCLRMFFVSTRLSLACHSQEGRRNLPTNLHESSRKHGKEVSLRIPHSLWKKPTVPPPASKSDFGGDAWLNPVPPRRFERPTNGLGNRCSIHTELRGQFCQQGKKDSVCVQGGAVEQSSLNRSTQPSRAGEYPQATVPSHSLVLPQSGGSL